MAALKTSKTELAKEINAAIKRTAVHSYTVIFPLETSGDDIKGMKILLGLKKRGMGVGLWNGFGGKVEHGETFDECAHRELKEECGLGAGTMEHVGVLFMKRRDGSGMVICVYRAQKLTGAIAESDEMEPRWFDVSDLPYDSAYKEARLWWPMMLSGKAFVGHFAFSNPDIIRYNIECVEDASDPRCLKS
ncbi:hypothetical protein EV175_000599 [Coemansia sp. RSA 1933]|nr:hypothetical protein EV175_000599 [Coemansia sp. RSA 1933]